MAKKIIIYGIFIFLTFAGIAIGLTIGLSFFAFYRYPQILPSNFTLQYWKNILFENGLFKQSLFNSIRIGILSSILSTVVGFMAGHGIIQMQWHLHRKVTLFYSLPLLIPISSLFIGVHMMMIRLNISSTSIGVVFAHSLISIPYATNIAISFFSGLSSDMLAIARTLGATNRILFKRIVLPLMLPGIMFAMGVCFLLSVSDYFATFLIGGGRVITISTLYYPFIANGDYGHSSVMSIIFIGLNIAIFFLVSQVSKKHVKVTDYLYE